MIPKIQPYPEIHHPVGIPQQARRRAMIVPREHGAWGLLLIPIFTGGSRWLRSGTSHLGIAAIHDPGTFLISVANDT